MQPGDTFINGNAAITHMRVLFLEQVENQLCNRQPRCVCVCVCVCVCISMLQYIIHVISLLPGTIVINTM